MLLFSLLLDSQTSSIIPYKTHQSKLHTLTIRHFITLQPISLFKAKNQHVSRQITLSFYPLFHINCSPCFYEGTCLHLYCYWDEIQVNTMSDALYHLVNFPLLRIFDTQTQRVSSSLTVCLNFVTWCSFYLPRILDQGAVLKSILNYIFLLLLFVGK